jgi:LAS superfamily LD-carboxypeptidase LdcB
MNKNCSYQVWKVWNSKETVLVAEYLTRNEAERLKKMLLSAEYREWVVEVISVYPSIESAEKGQKEVLHEANKR